MLPFALKMVWFVLCIVGTVLSWFVLMAFGSLLGSRWTPICYCFAMSVLEGMFCLGMVWRMNPFDMPPAFCLAQTILMEVATYVLAGLSMAFCIATSLHILKPKTWGNLEQSLQWRPIYILAVVVYPLVNSVIQITLNLKLHAVRPTDEMHCDVSDPLWVRLIAHTLPATFLFVPTVYLSVISTTRVVHTLKHFERSRRDQSDIPRQVRRSEHHSHKPSDGSAMALGTVAPENTSPPRLSFHLPFFRQLQSISQTLAPPAPSPNPSPGPYSDGRSSVASSSFPTFAPVIDKPTLYARTRPEEDDIADMDVDVRSPWSELDGDSCAPTTNEGHETPKQLELDVKSQDDDEEGTYRLSYREHTSTPSRVSHLAHVPTFTPQIYRLLFFQVGFALTLLLNSLSSIIDLSRHRTPSAFSTHHVALIGVAWGPALVFGSLASIRSQLLERAVSLFGIGRRSGRR